MVCRKISFTKTDTIKNRTQQIKIKNGKYFVLIVLGVALHFVIIFFVFRKQRHSARWKHFRIWCTTFGKQTNKFLFCFLESPKTFFSTDNIKIRSYLFHLLGLFIIPTQQLKFHESLTQHLKEGSKILEKLLMKHYNSEWYNNFIKQNFYSSIN